MRRLWIGPTWIVATALALSLVPGGRAAWARTYDVSFDVELRPAARQARVAVTIGRHEGHVWWLRFRNDPSRYSDWEGQGELSVDGEQVAWTPPDGGGTLRYTASLEHRRRGGAYDAHCTDSWALFRGHDLVPTVRVGYEDGATARSTMTVRAPKRWTVVAGHRRIEPGVFDLADPDTSFDRPTAWILAGRLRVLRETIGGMRVAVAAPLGEDVRRQDMLALLRLTLPKLRVILAELPERLTVVSAGDPMWRGGLSAPRSLYLHAERPLITADLTSPLLHEVMHAVVGTARDARSDWIVEGLAEYYSLELLVRSKAVSRRRHRRALDKLAARGAKASGIASDESRGATTARAVTILRELDATIREATDDARSLDSVLVRLARDDRPITNERFRALAEEIAGRDLGPFFRTRIGRDR